MNKTIIKIYDFLRGHRRLCLLSFLVISTLLFVAMLRLNFKEDIADFLPLEQRQQEALTVYQDVSGANKILAIFQQSEIAVADDDADMVPDLMVEAIEDFAVILSELDSTEMIKNLTIEFDLSKLSEVTDFAYSHIPYFLTDKDYERMDSLLASPSYIYDRLEDDKQLLMFPTTGVLSANLRKDPLNLFSPVVSKLGNQHGTGAIELYDGKIFTSDMSRAIAMMESPFGNSETKENAKLTTLLRQAADSVQLSNPGISVHFIGGPTIAVGNADRIKQDSLLSIAIAIVLIVALLVIVFRKPLNILLIVVSVAWGWLFAMALLSVVHDSVSLIVIGISSIILGIAVNYPLHLLAHMAHTQSMRQVLKEIIAPLVIGNITTVGAFVALIPLKAAALRDLGIFAAFILIGTIVFVIVYLPHIASFKKSTDFKSVRLLDWISNVSLEKHRWLTICVLILTIVFAYFSTRTRFDSDMSHINYMTREQKADMEYFKQFTSGESAGIQNLYVVVAGPTIDSALQVNSQIQPLLADIANEYEDVTIDACSDFLPSSTTQHGRLDRWRSFIENHREKLTAGLDAEAPKLGFSADAFDDFLNILNTDYDVLQYSDFSPISPVTSKYLSLDPHKGVYRIVTIVKVPESHIEEVKGRINSVAGQCFCFDVKSMNGAMAKGLSDNFNYIGWACGLIVFVFLWFSFGSIELAMLSFLPMAISWIWIMGIMGILDIQFNIVNIILATFIFGQGDDYTIFITEGCCYEYAYRRKMLASFKRSIIVSALIMFIGIGTLIFAKHPALHSLAQVTIIGMASVVLMAWLLPPVVFNWITRTKGHYRKRPLTLVPILRTWFCGAWWISQLIVGYILGFILFVIGRRTPRTEFLLHRFVNWAHRLDVRLFPGVKIHMHNPYNEKLTKPCIIVCNHQSLLDPMFFMAWSPRIIIVANERSSMNPVVRIMFKWLGFYTINQSNFTAWKDSTLDRDMEKFKKAVEEGYSIAFFPEGLRNPKSSVLRCHKGPFYLATKLDIDVLPVLLHGINHLMPKGSFACYSGDINIHIGKRIAPGNRLWNDDYTVMTKLVHRHLVDEYNKLCRKYETAAYFKSLVIDRYRYKGNEILNEVKKNLNKHDCYTHIVDKVQPSVIVVKNCGYGELPLLLALVHSNAHIYAFDNDIDKIQIARYSASGIVSNIEFSTNVNLSIEQNNLITYDLEKI